MRGRARLVIGAASPPRLERHWPDDPPCHLTRPWCCQRGLSLVCPATVLPEQWWNGPCRAGGYPRGPGARRPRGGRGLGGGGRGIKNARMASVRQRSGPHLVVKRLADANDHLNFGQGAVHPARVLVALIRGPSLARSSSVPVACDIQRRGSLCLGSPTVRARPRPSSTPLAGKTLRRAPLAFLGKPSSRGIATCTKQREHKRWRLGFWVWDQVPRSWDPRCVRRAGAVKPPANLA